MASRIGATMFIETARSFALPAAIIVALVSAASNLPWRGRAAPSHHASDIALCSQGRANGRAEIERPQDDAPSPPPARWIGCGQGGFARHIVFVCDASAAMGDRLELLKSQMRRAIVKMREPQTFDILFFKDGKAISLSRDELHLDSMLRADAETKRRACGFINRVEIGGGSDPSEALRLAFLRRPHRLYLLSNGEFPDDDAVRDKVSELNKPRDDGSKTRVNAIVFLHDEEDPSTGETLRKIAEEQQGVFLEVTEDDLAE
jgi:hypothetical protein